MKTEAYVKHGSFVTDHLAPINATIFIATGTLLPIMDFIRPYFPFINYMAGAVVFFFVVLLIMKLFKLPQNKIIPTSLVFCAGVCAIAFSVGAIASNKHADGGGFIAARTEDARALQSNLLNLERQTIEMKEKLTDIQAGKSTDPRVELKNIGVAWSESEFQMASKRGDLRVFELFLRGGMNINGSYGYPKMGGSIAMTMISEDHPRQAEQFALLKKYGYDLSAPSSMKLKSNEDFAPTLYIHALDNGKTESARILKDMGVNTGGYDEWAKAQKKRRMTYFWFPGT